MFQNEMFCCIHLGALENPEQELANFSVKNSAAEGLVNYIQHFALHDEGCIFMYQLL